MWSKKLILGAFLALLGVSVGGWYLWKTAYHKGVVDGVDFYHSMCYNNTGPGFVYDEQGRVVVCGRLTQLQEEPTPQGKPS